MIENFVKNSDFPQTSRNEQYTYEFDYDQKEKIIFLEMNVFLNNDINFSDQMSFEEFRIQLEEYAKNNPYPKIDD